MINSNISDRIQELTSVELWYEPSRNLQTENPLSCEMVESDHAFLCGMIKQAKPKKIVEIGVAEGGTTAVIMNCLTLLDMDSKVYSVDLNEKLYYDKNRETGYIWKDLSKYIRGKNTHQFKLGKTIAGCIDEIGADIDFVIIDTTHVLPGELLDFLGILPYLTKNAVVVLHDVSLNYISSFSDDASILFEAKNYNATKILYTTVVAQKWFYFEDTPGFNIAAFTINEDTIKYIADCFQALSLTWGYGLTDTILNEYKNIFLRYYNEQCIRLYDLAIKANNHMVNTFKVIKKYLLFEHLPKTATLAETKIEELKNAEKIIIYGAGIVAVDIIKLLQNMGIPIYAIAVSDPTKNVKKLCGIEVKSITEFLEVSNIQIIIASVLDSYIKEIELNLQKMRFTDIMKVDRVAKQQQQNSYTSPQFYK